MSKITGLGAALRSCTYLFALAAPLDIALAQAAQENTAGDIVVTAQKREQSINDVGLTIQAASADELVARGIDSPKDLIKLVPGFTYTESIYSTPVFTLRGIGLYDATFGAVPAVAVYTDQVPRNFPVMSAGLDLDLERVEVLKGPQGTLFGQSSTGGAINYIVAKPTEKFEAGVDASYERFGKVDLGGFVSGPLSDTLSARLAVRGVEGGDWQRSLSRPDDENGAQSKLTGRLTVDWKPTDKLKVEVSGTAARDQSDSQAPQYVGTVFNTYSAAALAAANANPATANPYGVVNDALYASLTTPGSPNYDPSFLGRQAVLAGRLNGADPSAAAGARAVLGTGTSNDPRDAEWTPGFLRKSDNEYYQLTGRIDYDLTDSVTLTSLSAWARQELDYTQDLDGTVASVVDVPISGTVKSFNQELRLSGDTPKMHWIVGASYDDSNTDQSNLFGLGDYSGNLGLITLTKNDYSSSLKSYAAFGNVEYDLTEKLTLQAGIRYTQTDQKASYCYNDPAIDTAQGTAFVFGNFLNIPPVAIQPGECFPVGDGLDGTTAFQSTITPVNRKLSEENTSYRAGLNYKFDQGTLVYATLSQGYKAGGFSAIGASSTSQYTPAAQEKVIAYEAGFKAPLFDRRVFLNGAAFFYDYTDKQVRGRELDPIFGLLEKMINVPKSEIWGVEGDVTIRPMAGLTVSASATYLQSEVTGDFQKYDDGLDVYNAQGYAGNFKGSDLPFTPEFSANADVQYEWNMGNLVPFVGGSVLYQGKQNTTFKTATLLANDFEIPDYTTVDLRAGIGSDDDRWKVTVFGRNVFDENYTTSITTYLDTRFRFMGRPATYGVTLRYRLQ